MIFISSLRICLCSSDSRKWREVGLGKTFLKKKVSQTLSKNFYWGIRRERRMPKNFELENSH